jgi:hypothetical protein
MPCLVGRSWLAEEFTVTDRDAHEETLELRNDPSVAPAASGRGAVTALRECLRRARGQHPRAGRSDKGEAPYLFRPGVQRVLERDPALTRVAAGVGPRLPKPRSGARWSITAGHRLAIPSAQECECLPLCPWSNAVTSTNTTLDTSSQLRESWADTRRLVSQRRRRWRA